MVFYISQLLKNKVPPRQNPGAATVKHEFWDWFTSQIEGAESKLSQEFETLTVNNE